MKKCMLSCHDKLVENEITDGVISGKCIRVFGLGEESQEE